MLVVAALFAGAVSVAAGCSRPPLEYPRCTRDDDCGQEKSGKLTEQVCAFGVCQNCAKNDHCGPDEQCTDGRCEARVAPAPSDAPAQAGDAAVTGCLERRRSRTEDESAKLRPEAERVLESLHRCRIADARRHAACDGSRV
jgi:hypothetical protein